MKTGNYKVAERLVHRHVEDDGDIYPKYLCGIGMDYKHNPGERPADKRTTKPVTCKNCLRVMDATNKAVKKAARKLEEARTVGDLLDCLAKFPRSTPLRQGKSRIAIDG